ncbi:amino acid antiporter [Legionella geestiana]|uniref:Amino acid antiporter n=1 Tax=Legionella geestiana TaxID=45065 RepID=A0A0W0TK36_9GAMM|nr:APC family permease [Legionella geestiana]KTC95867.1 amino acid antiporter [Legionella geestiana]QBS13278.1 amino acid permease [Legionella geestiana]QDQ40868.1 amino acid permease [Legionella geestiana]STX54195.1 Amino acid transporter [Legionella geestiana]
MHAELKSNQKLGLFALIMLAVISVDSLRNLPIAAQYGYALITFYGIAAALFFFPLAYITSRLVMLYPQTGGSYLWVTAAFGPASGTLALWLQWIYNMIWYPTIFVFIATILAAIIAPNLAQNTTFILAFSLGFFWIITWLHTHGIRFTRIISVPAAILGTLLPMGVMIVLAGWWLLSGNASATPFSWGALVPGTREMGNLGFFSNILFSLLGLEVIAMHGGNVENPQKSYPRALIIAAIIILSSIILSSLALCIILPVENITLISGLIDVLNAFFAAYNITNIGKVLSFCVILGCIGIASSWMVGLARGLHVAITAVDGPKPLQKLNKNHMPSSILYLQAVLYSVILGVFLLFPDMNNSYWILSAITAQFALLYYVLMFVSAMKLLRGQAKSRLGNVLNLFVPLLAISVCIFGIFTGFLPPEFLEAKSVLRFEVIMISGFVGIGILPIVLMKFLKRTK